MGADQRRYSRKPVAVQFSARDSSGTGQLQFVSTDVSAGGAFLKSELLLEVGEVLSLEFAADEKSTPIRAQAKVAWVRRFPEGSEVAGMGVEFTVIRDPDRALLLQFLGAN